MSKSQELSFATTNGRCHITADSVIFEYDLAWNRLSQIFGKPSWERRVRLAFILGVPFVCLAVGCLMIGLWHLALYPLFFGLILSFDPLSSLFVEEYYFPDIIPRKTIRSIVSDPPTKWKLSCFTITYDAEGTTHKTGFNLPCVPYDERIQAYQDVLKALAHLGLISEYQSIA